MIRTPMNLQGYLVTWAKASAVDPIPLPSAKDLREERASGDWGLWRLSSRHPLLDEAHEQPAYVYDLYLRRWRQRLIIVSVHVRVVEEALKRMQIEYRAVQVDIPKLVEDVTQQPHERFTLSRVFARVDGYGQALRSIAMYGDDIADASLFRSMLGQLLPYRVELRDIRTGHGLLSIASRGEIGFMFRGEATLSQVVETLKQLRAYVAWGDER